MQVVRLHQSDTCCIQDERMKLYNEYLVPLLQLKSVYYNSIIGHVIQSLIYYYYF